MLLAGPVFGMGGRTWLHTQKHLTFPLPSLAGTAIEGMNMDERMTICNMVVEAGGKNGLIAPDQTTFDYVNARTSEAYEPVYTDANASFCADYK